MSEEWIWWLDGLQERVAKDKLQFRTVFQRADADSDGTLTRKELKNGLQKLKVCHGDLMIFYYSLYYSLYPFCYYYGISK